jgi:hypothetical protein
MPVLISISRRMSFGGTSYLPVLLFFGSSLTDGIEDSGSLRVLPAIWVWCELFNAWSKNLFIFFRFAKSHQVLSPAGLTDPRAEVFHTLGLGGSDHFLKEPIFSNTNPTSRFIQ